ncbi:MAG: DEAD/DEAH box helicase, partial [Treponema sp.]|nr:DEAD/DEAH box helicase [Treponema sp.]
MSAQDRLNSILTNPEFAPNIVINRLLPAEDGSFAPFPEGLNLRIADSLRKRGVDRLYTHQAEVWEQVKNGKNVVVVTPTASGKTLCYNLPCLQALLADESARCLYLFPTKALSQDQQSELNEFSGGQNGLNIKITTYDGDTPESLRVSARDTGRIIISNPDMLHAGILPNHPKWIKFFSRLKFIVIDEAHAYRGVLGSHVANIIRRLRRIAAFYGAFPQFILCSATIGNPQELAEALIGLPVALVDKNGAPRGEKRVILYNPPLVDAVQGIRRSVLSESRRWMIALLRAGIKTILFAHSRIKTEIAASYVNEDLANIFTDNSRIRVEPYRGGLLPNERREIERGLREGSIQGVVSTNALELGIDIGGLDASVIAGFPGSFNSFWQQAGRAGRRGGTSVSVFIATASPIDQFIMNDPQWFFRKSAENGRIDPVNPYILTDHVKCGCFELPYRDGEIGTGGWGPGTGENEELGTGDWGLGTGDVRALGRHERGDRAGTEDCYLDNSGGSELNPDISGNNPRSPVPTPQSPIPDPQSPVLYALEYLEEAGIVRHAGDKWHWADRSFPAEGISIRSATADNVVIIDVTGGRNTVIGEMDRPGAKELIFDNAVYIHRGRQYLVEKLDIENRKAHVREADVNYFTDGLVKTDIKVLTEDEKFVIGTGDWGPGTGDERALGGHESGDRVETRDCCSDNNSAFGLYSDISNNNPRSPAPSPQSLIPSPQSPVPSPHSLQAVLSDVLVRSQVAKFKKIRFRTHENIGYGNIDLPEEEMQTRALVLIFGPQSAGGRILAEMDEQEIGAALSGAGTLIRNIAPVFLLCDPRDLGIAERVRDPHFGVPALYVYDKYPGGTGLSEGLSACINALFASVNEAIARCPCKTGCPSCVGPGGNKHSAQKFIQSL